MIGAGEYDIRTSKAFRLDVLRILPCSASSSSCCPIANISCSETGRVTRWIYDSAATSEEVADDAEQPHLEYGVGCHSEQIWKCSRSTTCPLTRKYDHHRTELREPSWQKAGKLAGLRLAGFQLAWTDLEARLLCRTHALFFLELS